MITLENVSKKFGTGVFAISDVSLSVEKGEFVFLVGPTGSGKTTIFRLLIREMLPTQGRIIVNSWDLIKIPNKKVSDLRKKIGVVFQDLKLLADRTTLENTVLPLDLAGAKPREALRRAEEVLAQVGILEHKDKFPIQLSGGELQRVAIARALILSPEIILADEPTGNLDDEASWGIVKLLSDINQKGTTVMMATHNREIMKKLNKRVIELSKGTIVSDKKTKDNKVKEDKKPATAEAQNENETQNISASENLRDSEVAREKHEEKESSKGYGKEFRTDDFEDALKDK